jgi:hypothetical protein
MAVAVIGGVLTSTFLCLLIVPAIFSAIDDFEHRLRYSRYLADEWMSSVDAPLDASSKSGYVGT